MKKPKHPARIARGGESYRRGWRAEWAALIYLMCKGYFPRALRYRSRGGEVDIIVQRENILAAIEVKARPNLILGHETMNAYEWRRRHAAMMDFTRRIKSKNHTVRFDLVIVTPYFRIQHLESAWQPDF
jgi:putative endonuclease